MSTDPGRRPHPVIEGIRSAGATLIAHPWTIWLLAVLAPVATALLLIPARGHLSAANDALIFVVVTVAIASSGNRGAAAVAALVSAASFDFFLTRPYQSFRIHDQADLTTELLFVLVGLLVGDLAARGRRYRTAAVEGRHGLARIHGVGEQIVGGEDPEFVLMNVATQLRELLSLQDCRFVREPPSGKGAWIQTDGSVRLNPIRWPTASVGLPTSKVELPVRGAGEVLGTFILTPTPAEPISHEQCVVAVALADQLGAALAAHRGTGWTEN
jgi:K+-sensing histidine kinase KdpD